MELLTNRIRQFLDRNDIAYTRIPHRRDKTARQAARDCHVTPAEFAKVVGLNADGSQILAVLPADHYVDLPQLKQMLGAGHIELLPEDSLATFFPDCEVGAESPLGNLYGLSVYIATELAKQDSITFNAGTHEEAIRMPYSAFEQIVRPTVLDFSCPSVDFSDANAGQ